MDPLPVKYNMRFGIHLGPLDDSIPLSDAGLHSRLGPVYTIQSIGSLDLTLMRLGVTLRCLANLLAGQS